MSGWGRGCYQTADSDLTYGMVIGESGAANATLQSKAMTGWHGPYGYLARTL